jgi:hypothetical protein
LTFTSAKGQDRSFLSGVTINVADNTWNVGTQCKIPAPVDNPPGQNHITSRDVSRFSSGHEPEGRRLIS